MAQITQLSNREREVVSHLLQGKTNRSIAASLGISERTVEFHLKNIYAKSNVGSRVELILKLGNITGQTEIRELGYSTVANPEQNTENGKRLAPPSERAASFGVAVSNIGTELDMKYLLSTKHVPAGVIAALLAGFSWIALWRTVGNMPESDIRTWILPLILIWVMIGLSIGMVAKRNGNNPLKACISTLIGTGLSPIAILPLMGFVVFPVAKLVAWTGLIDRSAISSDVATRLATIGMLFLWFVVGAASGIVLTYVTIKRLAPQPSPLPAAESHP